MRKIVFAFAAITAILASAPASAADVINENFESGTFGVFTPSASGQVGVNTGQDYHVCCGHTGSPAALANHFASFGSGDQPSGTISTALNLTLGETYTLYFDLASMGAGADAAWFAVDGSHWNVVQPANIDLDAAFVTYDFTFTATPFTTALEFGSGGAIGADAAIDNVRLVGPDAGAVPEPATWAMMLLGFAGIGFAMRRRTVTNGLAQVA